MEKYLDIFNHFFEKVPDAVRKYRIAIWAVFILLNVVILWGAKWFHIDMTMEAYFLQDDPVKKAYDRFRAQFGSDEPIFLIYEAKDGDVFSDQTLQAVKALQDEIMNYRLSIPAGQPSELDHITEVKSIINASYMEASSGDLLSRQFIGDQLPKNDSEREALRQRALTYPDYLRVYISEDSRYGAFVIKTDFGATLENDIILPAGASAADSSSESSSESTEISTAEKSATTATTTTKESLDNESLDEELSEVDIDAQWNDVSAVQENTVPKFYRMEIDDYARFMDEFDPIISKKIYTDHLKFYPVGNPPIMKFFKDVIIKDLRMIAVLSLLIVIVLLWILFRSISAVLWPVTIVVMTVLWIVGLIGWSGVIMTMMINVIVFLILSVGIADAVHILSGYLFFRQQNEDHETALRSVYKKSGLACFLTSFTTSMGMWSLLAVPIVPIRNFGLFAALGVMIACFLTIFMLPLMLDLWPPVNKMSKHDDGKIHPMQRFLRMIENIGVDYPKRTLVVFSIFALVLLYGAKDIKVDSNFVEIIPPDTLLRQSFALVDKEMSGGQGMEILFDAGEPDAFKDPDMLNRMAELEDYLVQTYPDLIGKTFSLVNITRRAYQALNDNDPKMYIIPQDPAVLSQTLFLFNNANPSDRRAVVSDDYSQARFSVTVKTKGTYTYVPVIESLQKKIDELFADSKTRYPKLEVKLTGAMSLILKLVDYISWSQVQSFGQALIVIALLMFVIFGSKRAGAVALIPNLLPILAVFGLMGYFHISLDTDTLLIAPIIIGIATDDTIHFLSHYRAGIYETGSVEKSIKLTLREAGQAIIFTSLVLSFGFLVFIFSSHMALRHFGILSAASIFIALLGDLILLPALCTLARIDFGQSRDVEENGSGQLAVD